MNPGSWMWLTIGGLLIAAISACGTKALSEFSRHELEMYCRARQRRELFGKILSEHEKVALGVENLKILSQTLFLLSAVLWFIFVGAEIQENITVGVSIVALAAALVLLFTTVWVPGTIVRLWSAPFLYHTWRLWKKIEWLFTPVTLGAHFVDAILHRLAGKQRARPSEEEFEDEIRTIVTEGLRDGHLEEDAREMIEGVIELSDADVADIMTPRFEIDAIEASLSWQDLLKLVTEVRRTRIPVYEREFDKIIGVLHVKDLLPELAKGPSQSRRSLVDILREAWFVPKTKPIDDLLHEFQRSRNHIAIVVDEYSSVAGVVTIEDVLEEIVGEIVDEHDQESEADVICVVNGSAELAARVHIDEVNDQLGLELPEDEEFDTIGGFVSMQLGQIPEAGEQLIWENTKITVLEASRCRVERVRIDLPKEMRGESA